MALGVWARTAVKLTAETVDALRPPRRGVVVLAYHRVGARTPIEVDLPLELFERQIAELAASRTILTLDEALELLRSGVEPPHRGDDPLVVTFDDGTADFVDDALPVLVRHQVPVTLYLATSFVEEQRPFPDRGAPISWRGLTEAVSTGLVTVGSHTHNHVLLDRVDAAEAAVELDRSVELIGERVGVRADHLAYPKAVAPTPAVEHEVRARFRSAALAGTVPNPPGRTDPHRLARTPIQRSDRMRWFRSKVGGGMRAEDQLRGLVDRRRYAGTTT